jgi:hypothetical protein
MFHRQALRLFAKMNSLGLLAAYKYLGPTNDGYESATDGYGLMVEPHLFLG